MAEDFFGNDELKKETRIVLKETQCRSSPSLSKRRTGVVSLTHKSSLKPPILPPRRLPGERGERRRSSSSNYFSLASKHFNATSTNELVLFSLPRNPPFRTASLLPRVLSRPLSVLRPPPSPPPPLPLVRWVRDSNLGQPLNADHESAHYFNCVNGNNSPRALRRL